MDPPEHPDPTSIRENLEEVPLGMELVLRLTGGAEVSGAYRGMQDDAVLIGEEEIAVGQIATVLIEGVSEGPE